MADPTDRTNAQSSESIPTSWFVGIIFAMALLAIGYLVFSANSAKASDLTEVSAGTYLLYENGSPACTAQAVKVDDKVLVLTANHCVTSKTADFSVHTITADEKTGKKQSEQGFFVDVAKADKLTDMAVLRLRSADADIATVDLATVDEADEALFKGAEVLAVGFPNTMNAPMGDLVITEGLFTGYSDAFVKEATGRFYRTTASVHYGNSGGGLYAEIDGTWKLVGVTSQLDPERPWETSLFSTSDNISRAVRFIAPKPATDK